ncbi:MAG: WYL domain-containing protein [Aphanocapsa sp. GSE-SYN-MK-11-07L]|jgi:predicted DNA-binding transcriptional regulator YafY|nr:WYL domain-containing protein [Aphanocapsa sp. GSE-SYN-MK-11-07L]
MSRHLERLLKLDALIRSGHRQTTALLSEAVEVSERTIRNDLAFMRDRFHAPLEFSKSKGFYYTDTEWRLPSISLSQGELFALTLGARMLAAYSGFAYREELSSAIARLSDRLPEQIRVDLQQVADERILFRVGAETNLDPEIWHQLEEACRCQQTVQMTYYTASRSAISDRKLDPYLLHIYRGTNPYLIGYCHQHQAIRWFRVDRIQQLKILEQSFVQDPTFDAKDHLEMIFQHEVGSIPVNVAIWFDAPTAPYIRERRWHPTQELHEHANGAVTLCMTVRGLNDLKRWILGYGKGAVVKNPPELVEMVRQEAEGILREYRKADSEK